MKRIPTEDRFWAKVDQSGGPSSCWLWTAFRDRAGYGQFWDGTYRPDGSPNPVGAHRWSYLSSVGTLGDDDCVLHRCDNPPCVNPGHLFAGSHKDNAVDRQTKGRGWTGDRTPSRGEANGSARLTAAQVADIRARYAAGGVTQRGLAEQFGVSNGLISEIVNRHLWK